MHYNAYTRKDFSYMKKNILKCITTIMLSLTLCTNVTNNSLFLQDTPVEITKQLPDSHIIDRPIPRD